MIQILILNSHPITVTTTLQTPLLSHPKLDFSLRMCHRIGISHSHFSIVAFVSCRFLGVQKEEFLRQLQLFQQLFEKMSNVPNNRKNTLAGKTNVFAVGTSQAQKQDRSYYKSLYNFNADVELAEYTLPILSNQIAGKVGSGAANTKKLPPISEQQQSATHIGMNMEMGDIEYDMDGNPIVMDPMEQAMADYDQEYDDEEEDPNAGEDALQYEDFRNIIETEGPQNTQMTDLRKANFIRKGTAIWHMQQAIQTGEQAISFFAKHGVNIPIKFLNCNRKPVPATQFRPYDLVVQDDEKKLKAEYFTISAQGVVQVFNSARKSRVLTQPAEFFSLSEWMQQATMFNVLTSMKFFKLYLISKVFSLWKGNVRHHTFRKTRLDLAKNLIQARPDFQNSYVDINRILYEMQNNPTFNINKNNSASFEIQAFMEEQKSNRDLTKGKYNTFVEDIIQNKLANLLKAIENSTSMTDQDDLDNNKIGQAAKHKSMVLLKEEKNLKNRVNYLAQRNKTNLGTFIRLIDYMVVEMQVRINQESADMILFEINNPNKKYFINTVVGFDNTTEDNLSFNPPKQQFRNDFEQLLQEMQLVTADLQRVITHPDFHAYMHGLHQEKGPNFKTIVDQSFRYNTTKNTILTRIESDFTAIEQKSQAFNNCYEIHEFFEKFKFEDFQASHDPSDLDAVKQKFDQFNKYDIAIGKSIKQSETMGLIQAMGRKLKETLVKNVQREQAQLRKYLNSLAEQLTRDIQNGLSKIRNTLGKQTTNLKDYVELCKMLKESHEQFGKMDMQKKKLEDMKAVLGKYREKQESGGFTGSTHIQLLQTKIESITLEMGQVAEILAACDVKSNEQKETNTEQLVQQVEAEKEKLTDLITSIQQEMLMKITTKPSDAIKELKRIESRYNQTMEKVDLLKHYEETLGAEPTSIPQISSFEKKFKLRQTIWESRETFANLTKTWKEEPFKSLNSEQIVKTMMKYDKDNLEMKIRLSKDEKDEVLEELDKEVKFMLQHASLITSLGKSAMQDRHWKKVYDILDAPLPGNLDIGIKLDDLLEQHADEHVQEIEDISGYAEGEQGLEANMKKVKDIWTEIQFTIVPYRDSKERFILGDLEDLMTQLEDDQMQVSSMMGSKYVAIIRDEVERWEKNLTYIQNIIDEWVVFQRQWMYLENIFASEDIIKQLPQESQLFKMVDKFWKEYMSKEKKEPKCMAVVDSGANLKKFIENNKKLEEIQKALEEYLGTKRAAFSRFYFLSNDELLEILSQTRNVQAVQPHMNKCFDAIKKIQFTEEKNSKEIIGLISPEGEIVKFSTSVMAIGAVEHWLGRIEYMMTQSLYDITKNAINIYPENGIFRDEWLFHTAAQPILTVDMVMWTKGVETAIYEIMKGKNASALKEFLDFSTKQLSQMIKLVRGKLLGLQRMAIGALIVLDVHALGVVTNMIKARVEGINDFEWSQQLRYYWEALIEGRDGEPYKGDNVANDIFAKQTNTRFRYGYEYLGNGPRLVITPLTDQCYMTLTGALHLNFGGNPAGPAGTGKTETTKDLGKALAVYCVVFNCSDGLDFKIMGRFFTGLASGGAWSCFDEFNRIDIEVLSVIAQQILTIQAAVRARLKEFDFEGKIIPLNLRFGVFITMNPGYAGRTELPDNLKALFRPMAMMIPDYRLIAEIILYSEGFETARALSKKMVKLYSLSSEQLSKQDHYDFGMRAVKSVLVMAGKLRRADSDTPEDILLIRAMRDSNVPKFLSDDLPLFSGIITDLFPGVVVPHIDYGKLEVEIKNQLRLNKLQDDKKDYITKIIQLLQTMTVRHGNMIVGTTGTGKTTLSNTLAAALTALHKAGEIDYWYQPVHIDTLNPKSVSMGELFGEVNKFTGEWTEGIVSELVKRAVLAIEGKDALHKRWINFDGPVDALWIENMNTVLDDNKMLCLNNGQRIKMPEICTMMFEVNDLKVASPATVSRCGMVYLEPVHLGWEVLVRTWTEEMVEFIIEPYLSMVSKILLEMLKKMLNVLETQITKEKIQTQKCNLVRSCLNLMQIFLNKERINLDNRDKIRDPDKVVLTYLAFSVIWSLGANVHDEQRTLFGEYFRGQMQLKMPDFPTGDVFEFGINPQTHQLESWQEQIPSFKFNPKQNFFDILVPTSDTVKFKYLLQTLMYSDFNVLFGGETGVGKSVIVKDFLMTGDEKFVSAFVNFSGKTSCKNLQDAFEGNLEAKRKTLLGPPAGKKMIFFIDDVNMPQLEKYGAQPPCELLRQTIDSGGFYDIKALKFKQVKDTKFVAACGPPGGGRSAVTPRLFRHFNIIWVPSLSTQSMKTIFSAILKGNLELKVGGFSPSIFADVVIKSAVDVYNQTITTYLPTPSKCHYTFNLRDMSKVIQGMLMCSNEDIVDKDYLVFLYLSETYRVFRDRLIDEKDRQKFSEMSHTIMEKYLSMEWELKDFQNVIFGDFENVERKYIKLSESQQLLPCLDQLLMIYNSEGNPMNLVFFDDCIQHLARIARILRQQRGNAMLVGVGGSGRRSMARLAASINKMITFSIEITKNYREKEWWENIKELLKKAGLENEKTQFLFSDTQIVRESFLEDINNLLNSGEIPNLFPQEEKAQICDELADRARALGFSSRDAITAYFVATCRENLHIVLAFSPVGQQFRDRCRQFPSIINCCTIDWYNAWPQDALYSVAYRQFEENANKLSLNDFLDQLSQTTVFLHESVKTASELYFAELRRYNYVTPTSYLDLIKTYIEMLRQQQLIVPVKMTRYQNGLTRLGETNLMVDELKNKLVKLMPEIQEKTKNTVQMVEDLEIQSKDAAEIEKTTAVEEAASKKIYNEVMAIKSDCELILGEAMPALNKALAALDTLDKKDIVEMKMYTSPPEDLVLVLDAVCILLGEKPSWDQSKKLMNNPQAFITSLQKYDKDNIKPKLHKAIKVYTSNPRFVPSEIKKKSAAGESLCMWCHAMDKYTEVKKIVGPKEEALAIAEKQLTGAQSDLKGKQQALQLVRDKINRLQNNYKAQQQMLEDLNRQKETTEIQLMRAGKLVGGLKDESIRWALAIKVLEKELVNLMGNTILAAGYISYVGTFTQSYRNSMLKKWMGFMKEKGIPFAYDFTATTGLGDPVKIREWGIKGLPADQLSTENGILTTQTKRWPLMIDPQSQANKWIKNMEKANGLTTFKMSNTKMAQYISMSIKNGKPVLLENIEEILDPMLEPLLQKNIVKFQGSNCIKFGEDFLPFSPDFKFFMTTKLSNPHYLPEICIKVCLINFTVTPDGLEDQLLVEVVKCEQPEIEQQKDQLIIQLADFKRQLKELEDKILKLVSEASADILNDEELIITLDQSKVTSDFISERMVVAEETAKVIEATRESYRTVAKRGSVLYFVIADLANVDPMYQYSLEFFTKLFVMRLEKSTKNPELEKRLQILVDDVTRAFYFSICRGLFEKDKLLFSFLNASSILRRNKDINIDEWNFFLRGSPTDFSGNENLVDFITIDLWRTLLGLEECHQNFKDLTKSFQDPYDKITWKTILTSDQPSQCQIPALFEGRLTSFQKCMLQKALRPGKMIYAVKEFVKSELGATFIESPPFDLEGTLNDSNAITPIIFVLSPGADPIAYLVALAEKRGMKEKLKAISLGQGQGKIAEKLIAEGQATGMWVCLQNCHLYASWMGDLERIQENQRPDTISPDYRLWLTSSPSSAFPVPVLQGGLKLTNEPPKGLKANMTRSLTDVGEARYESCSKSKEYKKLVFALAYFHAAILERRKYGAIGWNISYEWMNSDFNTSERNLLMYLEEQPDVPYQALNYLVASVNYGGRVTDDKDVRCIRAMLKKYFCSEIMNDNYKLSKLDTYYAPPDGSLSETLKYISQLPLDEDPEVFGLHSNANIAYELKTVNNFMDTILVIQPRASGGKAVKTPEEIVVDMANNFATMVPKHMKKDKASPLTFALTDIGAMNSLGVFIGQEIDRFNILITVMMRTLDQLVKAIAGTVVMSQELELMFNKFLDNKVPLNWEAVGYPCLKPLTSWMKDLIARMDFMSTWLYNGPPATFWLPAFYFPQGFITATLQMYARKTATAIDTLSFKTNVMPYFGRDVKAPPEIGVNIHGLYMQGAKWDDRKKSVEDSNVGVPIVEFPLIWLEPVLDEDLNNEKAFACPLYKTSVRAGELSTTGHSTNFVLYLHLTSEVSQDWWIRRGAALLCMTDD